MSRIVLVAVAAILVLLCGCAHVTLAATSGTTTTAAATTTVKASSAKTPTPSSPAATSQGSPSPPPGTSPNIECDAECSFNGGSCVLGKCVCPDDGGHVGPNCEYCDGTYDDTGPCNRNHPGVVSKCAWDPVNFVAYCTMPCTLEEKPSVTGPSCLWDADTVSQSNTVPSRNEPVTMPAETFFCFSNAQTFFKLPSPAFFQRIDDPTNPDPSAPQLFLTCGGCSQSSKWPSYLTANFGGVGTCNTLVAAAANPTQIKSTTKRMLRDAPANPNTGASSYVSGMAIQTNSESEPPSSFPIVFGTGGTNCATCVDTSVTPPPSPSRKRIGTLPLSYVSGAGFFGQIFVKGNSAFVGNLKSTQWATFTFGVFGGGALSQPNTNQMVLYKYDTIKNQWVQAAATCPPSISCVPILVGCCTIVFPTSGFSQYQVVRNPNVAPITVPQVGAAPNNGFGGSPAVPVPGPPRNPVPPPILGSPAARPAASASLVLVAAGLVVAALVF